MPTKPRLSSRDLDAVLHLVGEAAAASGSQPFELHVVEDLLDLVPADRAGYYECADGAGGGVNTFEIQQPWFDFGWEHVDEAHVVAWPLNNTRLRRAKTALRFSDFFSRRERSRNRWYAEVMRPRSIEHELKIGLPAPAGVSRGFFFVRSAGARDFDERDRSVLTLLLPHLAAIRERWERRHRPAELTEREIEVWSLLRKGLTNKQIARQLVIAPGTVQTHLENIFGKLGVHTRTAAIMFDFNSCD